MKNTKFNELNAANEYILVSKDKNLIEDKIEEPETNEELEAIKSFIRDYEKSKAELLNLITENKNYTEKSIQELRNIYEDRIKELEKSLQLKELESQKDKISLELHKIENQKYDNFSKEIIKETKSIKLELDSLGKLYQDSLLSIQSKYMRQFRTVRLLTVMNRRLIAKIKKKTSEYAELKEMNSMLQFLISSLFNRWKIIKSDANKLKLKTKRLEIENKENTEKLKSVTDDLNKSKFIINDYEKRLVQETAKTDRANEQIRALVTEKDSLLKENQKLKENSVANQYKCVLQ